MPSRGRKKRSRRRAARQSPGRTSRTAATRRGGAGSGGGAATLSGTTFQENVAAQLAVRILAESAASAGFGLPVGVTLEAVLIESRQPVDDVQAWTSQDGRLYFQCKTYVDGSTRPASALGQSVSQFVRQMISGASRPDLDPRPLDPARDRLVLACSDESPATIQGDLVSALEALRSVSTLELYEILLDQRNAAQRRALMALQGHFDREWRTHAGNAPRPDDWLKFLQLFRLQCFSFDLDRDPHVHHNSLLRGQILVDPAQSDQAWAAIVGMVRGLGPMRSGADRAWLRQTLSGSGLRLRAPRSFQDDVETIRRHTRDRLALLERQAVIPFRGSKVRIPREVVGELASMAAAGPVVVLGEPGAGKSGCLHAFTTKMIARGHHCVLLEAEHVDASTLPNLSTSLGLGQGRSIIDVLRNWPADAHGPRYLVIDALDAARGKANLQTLCDLVHQAQECAEGWNVVVSIREFDLRHAITVQDAFRGDPHPALQSPEFGRIRHVYVSRLNDAELAFAVQHVEGLGETLTDGGAELGALVRNPFNLRLLSELIEESGPVGLSAIAAQSQLLDRYWERRVAFATEGAACERAAAAVWTAMKGARDMRIDRGAVADGGHQPAIERLVASGVLRFDARSALPGAPVQVRFTHNILFDYAGARLWLADVPAGVLTELEHPEGEDLVLFARPSVVIAFERLWHLRDFGADARGEFWERAIAFTGSRVRLSGKIIPARVAVSEFRSLSDIRPILDRLSDAGNTTADTLFGYVIAALLSMESIAMDGLIIGEGRRPWLAVAEALTERGQRAHAWRASQLLFAVWRNSKVALTPDQQRWANRSARTLLAWIIEDPSMKRYGRSAIGAASRTIRSDVDATVNALAPLLDPSRSGDWYETLGPIGDHFAALGCHAPRFAAKVIRAAFGHTYDQEDRYNMGDRLLALSMGKGDTLDMTQRAIASKLRRVAERRPRGAAYLLITLLEKATTARRGQTDRPPVRFELLGQPGRLRPDYSYIWDGHEHLRTESWAAARAAFRTLLRDIGEAEVDPSILDSVLRICARHARSAFLWRDVMREGSRSPRTMGVKLVGLLCVPEILAASETHGPSCGLLRAVWPILTIEQRRSIEAAIQAIRDGDTDPDESWRDAVMGRLLAAIAAEQPRAGGAGDDQPVSAGADWNEVPPGWPRPRLVRSGTTDADAGATASDADRRMNALTNALKQLTDGNNRSFRIEEVRRVLELTEQVRAELRADDAASASPDTTDRMGWAYHEAIGAVARCPELRDHPDEFNHLKAMLLEASHDPQPQATSPDNASVDDHMWHGSGQPRIEAAEGLIDLIRHTALSDAEVFEAIERLSRDEHRIVRFQVRAYLDALWGADRELMWRLIEEAGREEADIGVLRWFVNSISDSLRGVDASRIDQVVTAVQERVGDGGDPNSIPRVLAHLVVWRAVVQNHEPSVQRLEAWRASVAAHLPSLQTVVSDCRALMVIRNLAGDGARAGEVRAWAFQYLCALISQTWTEYEELCEDHRDQETAEWADEQLAQAQALLRLATDVAIQVYFASGAFNDRSSNNAPLESAQNPEEFARFLVESAPLLEALCDLPCVHTAHRIVDTLHHLAPYDPTLCFRLLHRCLMAATSDAAQFEQMMADGAVTLIERYMSEHRALLREDRELLRKLLDILDLFVNVGWPKAMQCAFRLDEVFR